MSLKDEVEKLYLFRDHYFKFHSADHADKKIEDLTIELNKTLKLLDAENEANSGGKAAERDFLRAKAMNVLPEFKPEVLETLTKLVKFHPKYVEAWNELGNCFWKKGDIKAAKSCFESALREEKNPESLRNLSMILRQIGDTPQEKIANFHQSLEKAKEAVNLNIRDGGSWYVLGNAYLSLFFATDQNPNMLKQCLSSYCQANTDEFIKCNPCLHYNWAMALKYDENYRQALEALENALKLDPLWNEPREQLEILVRLLENIQLMVAKKGKLKPRKIKDLLTSLEKECESSDSKITYINPKGQSVILYRSKFSELQVGPNIDKVLIGKVVCQVYCDESPSFTFCMIDEDENCFAVNVYNMLQGKGVIIGDTVAIHQPLVRHLDFSFKNKAFTFSVVRVNSPLQLEVNKKMLHRDVLAAPKLYVTLKND